MVALFLGAILRQSSGGCDLKEFAGYEGPLGPLLEKLCDRAGASLRTKVFDGARVRKFLSVYVDGVDIRFTGGLATATRRDSSVDLLPAVAGG